MSRRYEREIVELLERDERDHRGRERIERVRRNVDATRQRVQPRSTWERFGGLSWMIASLVLAIFAFIIHSRVPLIGSVLVCIAVGLFFVPVVLRTDVQNDRKMWRGEIIDLPPRSGPFQGVRHYLWQIRTNRRRQRNR